MRVNIDSAWDECELSKKKKKSLADKLQPLQTFATLLLFIVLWQLPWVSFLVAEPSSVVFNTVPTSVCLQGLCLPKDFVAPSHGIRILTYLIKTIFSWDRVSKWPVTCQRSEIGWRANLGSVCFLHWNHKNLFFNTWLTPWVRNLNSDPYTFQVSTLWTEKSFQPSDSFFFFQRKWEITANRCRNTWRLWVHAIHHELSPSRKPFCNSWIKGLEWTWVFENDEEMWLVE